MTRAVQAVRVTMHGMAIRLNREWTNMLEAYLRLSTTYQSRIADDELTRAA
jgi:hypothetical protein